MEFSPCRFFIWKDVYAEYLRSSGIMLADQSGIFEGQVEYARSMVILSTDNLSEVITQLRQINEVLSKIWDGLGAARVAYAGACSAARKTRIIVLSLILFVLAASSPSSVSFDC